MNKLLNLTSLRRGFCFACLVFGPSSLMGRADADQTPAPAQTELPAAGSAQPSMRAWVENAITEAKRTRFEPMYDLRFDLESAAPLLEDYLDHLDSNDAGGRYVKLAMLMALRNNHSAACVRLLVKIIGHEANGPGGQEADEAYAILHNQYTPSELRAWAGPQLRAAVLGYLDGANRFQAQKMIAAPILMSSYYPGDREIVRALRQLADHPTYHPHDENYVRTVILLGANSDAFASSAFSYGGLDFRTERLSLCVDIALAAQGDRGAITHVRRALVPVVDQNGRIAPQLGFVLSSSLALRNTPLLRDIVKLLNDRRDLGPFNPPPVIVAQANPPSARPARWTDVPPTWKTVIYYRVCDAALASLWKATGQNPGISDLSEVAYCVPKRRFTDEELRRAIALYANYPKKGNDRGDLRK